MSKKDGGITSTLNISFPVRYNTKVYTRFSNSSGQDFVYSSSMAIPNQRHYGQDFVISDVSSDTIYRLTKNRELIPLIVRTPSVHATDPYLVCTSKFITNNYMFLHINTLDYVSIQKEKPPPAKTLMYNFETGEITTFNGNFNTTKILQKNREARLIDVAVFKDSAEEIKLDGIKVEGELKELLATLWIYGNEHEWNVHPLYRHKAGDSHHWFDEFDVSYVP